MNKLRWTFISIATGAVVIVLAIVLSSLYVVSTISNHNEIYSIVEYIIDNSGKMPHIDTKKETVTDFNVYAEMQYETRYFSLLTDEEGNIVSGNFDFISTIDKEAVDDLLDIVSSDTLGSRVLKLFNTHSKKGFLRYGDRSFAYVRREISKEQLEDYLDNPNFNGNRFAYYDDSIDYDSGNIIVFLDCTRRMLDNRSLKVSMFMIGIISFLLFFLIISAYSKRAIKPYIENAEKQKTFITNAGHELKTPLTIISANMEVLEMLEGKNEWTESTLNQVKRLTGLVSDLITIARSEEYYNDNAELNDTVNATEYVRELADSFRPVAEKEFKRIETEIDDDVVVTADKKTINELFSILIDNAVKYCDDKGTVKIELHPRKKGLQYVVSNDFAEGKNADYTRFFERFYRGDQSHNSEKAGYGIGLSMAETIVKRHKGKISVHWNEGRIYFTVII